MKKPLLHYCAAGSIALLTWIIPARAAVPVPITNAGFENPVLANGAYTTGTIAGWSVVNAGDIGTWNPAIADFPAQAPEGSNVAYVYSATTAQGCSQVLSGPTGLFQLGASYTLMAKVGNSASYTGFPGYQVQLLAGETVLAQDDNTSPPGEGLFVTSTVNYTYNAAHSELAGLPLEIRLLSKGLQAGENEMEFDDVQLTVALANPIAAPGGPYAVLSIGSLALDGSGSLPPEGSSISLYEWDLNNDGTFGDVTGATPAAIPATTLMSTYGLALGENTIKLRVTDASTKTSINSATVTLTIASSDADLFNLVTNPDMNLGFDSSILNYAITEPYATTTMTVTPTASDPGAKITIAVNSGSPVPIISGSASAPIPLIVGANTITTVVTAEDTVTKKTYTLTVTRSAPSNNASLDSLLTSPDMVLTPAFASGTLSYTATVPYPAASVIVTPTAADALATIKVNGNTVASGSDSAPISLSPGVNIITTVVTAEDATTQKTYTLTVTVTVADPVAIPGGPYSVSFGGSLSLNGSASLPSDGHTITAYNWDLDNDGDFNDFPIAGVTPASITYADLQSVHGMTVGANTIKLRVTDSSSKTSTVEGMVTINPPVSIFTSGTVQPAFDGADQGYFNSPTPSADGSPGDKWFAEATGAGQTKGQTFTVTGDRLLKGITYRLGNSKAEPTKVYVIRIGAVDTVTNVFYPLHSQEITQTVSWGATGVTDSYGTWTFATPIQLPGLPAGTVYGFDIAMKSSTTAWQTGIPYPTYKNTNVFAGGYKYTCAQVGGALGSASNTVQPDANRDREFHLDMDSVTITDTTAPTLVSIGDNVSGGPIYADQVQVIYTLTFNEAINASTIDLADFENLGSGVSIDSVVSVQNTTPYPAASVIRVVLGISGTGTLNLGVRSGSNIADTAGNLVTSPVADDTAITVNTGTNPAAGNRWWDLATSGITDGASQGGTGAWNTTTTNWDRGFGFAAPIAWNNTNNDNAIFGGTAGTVTLAEDITLGNLTFDVAGSYTVTGGTLNFAPGSTIRTSDNRYSQTITSAITGSPAVETKDFGAGNTYLGFVFAPASGTQTLGTVLNPNNTGTTDKAGVTLGGSTTGNSVVSIDYAGGDQYADVVKTGTGTWTTGNIRTGTIRLNQGTLIINGTATAMYQGFVYTAGTLSGNASLRRNDRRGNHDILSGFTVAPGNGVGTITVLDGTTQTPTAAQQFTTFRAGAIYEWEIGPASQDTVHIAAGKLQLDGFTLKIRDAGGAPANGTVQLPVFTYDPAKVTTRTLALGSVVFDTTDLVGKGWTIGPLALTDNGTGTIHLTGLSKSAGGYATWASANAPTGTAKDDYDGDGVSNGVEYVVGGTKDTNDLARLPQASTTPGGDVLFTFVRDQASIDGTTTVAIEVGTDLATWNTPPSPYAVPAAAVANNPGVTVVKDSPVAGRDTVTLALPRAPDAKKFARLKVSMP